MTIDDIRKIETNSSSLKTFDIFLDIIIQEEKILNRKRKVNLILNSKNKSKRLNNI